MNVVVVDEGPPNASPGVVAALDDPRIRALRQIRNQGKDVVICLAAEHADGGYTVILDTHLEYERADVPRLTEPIRDDRAKVLFGRRTSGSYKKSLRRGARPFEVPDLVLDAHLQGGEQITWTDGVDASWIIAGRVRRPTALAKPRRR
jgi:hypothetical protein